MNNKSNIVAGFLPLATMILLFGGKYLLTYGFFEKTWDIALIIEITAMVVPIMIAALYAKKVGVRYIIPRRSIAGRQVWFTLVFGLAVSFLAFLANFVLLDMLGGGLAPTDNLAFGPWWRAILVTAIIPAIFEELLFRGAMQSILKEWGTAIAIVVPALCFSIIHTDMQNIAGSFIVGLACGYATYSFNSIVPAIMIHLICNLFYYIMEFLIKNYQIFGLVPYFLVITAFLLLILTYLVLGNLEKLLIKNKIEKFKHSTWSGFISSTLGSPGVVILFLVVIMSAAYNL